MTQAEKYLNDLMYHISTTHLGMGNKHWYTLRASGFQLVSEIKVWMAQEVNVVDKPES